MADRYKRKQDLQGAYDVSASPQILTDGPFELQNASGDNNSYTQVWRNNAGDIVGYIDGNGNLVVNSVSPDSGDKNYEEVITAIAGGITLNHNLGKYPAVQVIDSAGTQQLIAIQHNSKNQAALGWEGTITGTAIAN